MARTYSALYRAPKADDEGYVRPFVSGQWSVVYKDDNDKVLYVELEDSQDKETSLRIAEALNIRETSHERPDIG